MSPARSSRHRYQEFVEDYKHKRLDQKSEAEEGGPAPATPRRPGARRAYLRDYMRWLRPHRYALGWVFVLALVVAGLQMIEPLFIRFIVDHVILNKDLDNHARLTRLNLTGLVFLSVVILSHVGGGYKDYRQRILNVRVMLSLRRSLYERLLHLPLPRLWDMKTGGILSRLSGDVETTTGLLQMAIVSPAISVIRLIIAIGILVALNWQLALTAMASRMADTAGETRAICMRPVVVSTSPVRRDKMPPVFMSHSFVSGRCSNRWNSDRRSESITRTFRRRWR